MSQDALPSVEVYRGLESLRALSGDWQRLSEKLGRRRFFHFHGWWKSYLETLEEDPASVWFYLVRCEDQPAAIIPLKHAVHRLFGLRTRQWRLPQHFHMPLSDILCARDSSMPDVLAALLQALRAHDGAPWDALMFDCVLDESALAKFLLTARGRVLTSVSKTCDHITCQGSYGEMTAGFSRNFRSNLNKARNKLAQEAGVEFVSVTRQPELARCFADFLDLEASGWRGAGGSGTAIKLHPELVKFYEALIEELGREGAVVINCLRVGGTLVAGQFCLRDEDTLYILKLAYDEAWSRIAPGNMLLERTVQDGINGGGFTQINLVGDPSWFKDWRPASQNVHTIWLFNNTPGAWALRSLLRMKLWLRPFYRKYLKSRLDASSRNRSRPARAAATAGSNIGAGQTPG